MTLAVVAVLLLAAAALAPAASAADGSVAPRLAWQARGWDIDFSPDGELVAIVYSNLSETREPTTGEVVDYNVTNVLQVRRAATGEVVAEAVVSREQYEFYSMVRWSPAGDRIAVRSSSDETIRLWSWDGGILRHEGDLDIDFGEGSRFDWSPNGMAIVSGRYVWDVPTRTVVATLNLTGIAEGRGVDVTRAVWSPTGDTIYLGYTYTNDDGWSIRGHAAVSMGTGRVVWSRDGASWFDVSPDGRSLVVTPMSPLITIPWPAPYVSNASTGDVVARWPIDTSASPRIVSQVWSSDGRAIFALIVENISLRENASLRESALFAYPSFDRIATVPLIDGTYGLWNARFDPDDRRLAGAWRASASPVPTLEEYVTSRRVGVVDLAPPPPVLLIGGVLAVTGGGAIAVGYGWRRRGRKAAEREDGS